MKAGIKMTNLERAKEFFKHDVYATSTTGIEIEEVSLHHAVVSLKIEQRHLNAANTVMGGVLFTMADFAFAVAANFDRPLTVTLASQISFLNAAKGEKLFAEAKCITEGNRTNFYEVDITDNLGTQVAKITSNGYKMRSRFPNSYERANISDDPYREQKT